MQPNLASRLTSTCVRLAWPVILLVVLLAAGAGFYITRHFAISTNVDKLMPASLPWVQREHAYQQTFPTLQIVAELRAPTPELVGDAAHRLTLELRKDKTTLQAVEEPQNDPTLLRAGLLFPPLPQVERVLDGLNRARPLLAGLAADPTLRGAMDALAGAARMGPEATERPSAMLADTLEQAFTGKKPTFSWQVLLRGTEATPAELRQLLPIQPVLDFSALQPAKRATDAIRVAAAAARIGPEDGARLNLTGQAPVNDEQFATLSSGALLNGLGTAAAVLLILWLALRSSKIVLAVVLNLIAGLALTASAGLLLVGAFNLLSVAFAVLFVGLGADFGIQFGVRYREERFENDDVRHALRSAATKAGGALALAAAGVTAGFFSFLPTDYEGVSELGEIAGTGMLIGFALTLTFLPALLTKLRPRGEAQRMGYTFLAPVDAFLGRHRIAVVVFTLGVVLAGSPLLYYMQFDFDPMHLQDPNGEAVRTYRALGRDPGTGVAAVDAIAPSLAAARALATRLDALPQVAGTRTIDTLIPPDQAPKLAAIRRAATTLLPAIDPAQTRPPPTDAETVAAIRAAASALPAGPAQDRVKPLLTRLADADPALRNAVAEAITRPLTMDLALLRAMLSPEPVTVDSLPTQLRADWLRPDGQARVEILPKGDPDDTAVMAAFARAVLGVAPGASGEAITLLESGRTVIRSFVEAGMFAVLSIAVILWITLRKLTHVLLTLVPLLVAAALTLEVTVLIGQPLNFANIIALPLLLGVGVAFKIYYILAWRRGATNLLQSTLTRAVFFSALTTATAFGSLWLSNDPGMASMGKLMALALLCTMLAAVLFQPALMGPPRGSAPSPGRG
jgi:hopanoid biosynthesis associated RND transporter like protein HpnN